jgi:hypothetical protein
MIPKPFPSLSIDPDDQDRNPAIKLFGRRFFADQTAMELLAELLLVLHSPKLIGKDKMADHLLLPPREQLLHWPANQALCYQPKMRLNLKLFAFLGSSKLDTRHSSHRQHYKQLLQQMKDKMDTANAVSKDDVLRGLENLFQGFQGAGLSRTWCAQTFLPVSPGVLAGETLWNETHANAEENLSWDEAMEHVSTYFSLSKHRFMARGGELLYLQTCNALSQSEATIASWIKQNQFAFAGEESSPALLYDILTKALPRITNQSPPGIQELASWIDQLDAQTTAGTDDREASKCGWCPEESWAEGYLFAVELARICRANIDPIERIELLVIGCALQVLRSLCAQSVRYDAGLGVDRKIKGGALGFAWIVAGPTQRDRASWKLSERNLMAVQNLIYTALRHEDILALTDEKDYAEADRRYGHKLFLSLAKKIGFVVPQRGPGAHFTLNDKILRYLVLALVRPGQKCTLDSFKSALYQHYGMAFAGEQLKQACRWTELAPLEDAISPSASWFEEMLRTAGFLVHLSDACSLVHNPFDGDDGDAANQP